MTASQPDEEVLFNAARQIGDHAARAQYLREAAGGNDGLLRRVEALLAVHDAPDRLLDRPVVAGGVAVPCGAALEGETISVRPPECAGTHIGPYKLLQQIGEGGMGTVFLAEQTHPVQRQVALKVIKAGMDSAQVIARFEAERQALALMDHVNIARVFEGGTTESGRPYFAMELVHGVPITKYCDDNHLTPRGRLELFVPVCQAIQHAHQKGIIHRDVKPSNVMITLYDGKPVPKVIDFGVAKATEQKLTARTLFTQYGTIIGTPEYMSPEQAEMSALGVDTRSDIYSLGVLLYELLTGSTPLTHKRMKEAAYAEILRMIKEEEPPRPSTRLSDSGEALASISAQRHMEPAKLTKLVRGELDWIVMKTLEKDRNRRYETAKDFATDVQRYLDDEPVQACPPSVGYRFRKFARRNKAALAFTGLVLLTLLTVTGGIGWNVRDRAARQTAVEHEVSLALKEAEQLQELAKWPEALAAAKRAQGLLAGGGSDELRERVRQLRKDLDMVLRLEDIRLVASKWTKDDKFDHETADRSYAQAFADYGIDVAGLPADEAATRIRERAGVADALTAALDEWAFCRAFSGRKPVRAGGLALTALAQSADPDQWRRQVRQAVNQKDTKALAALAASPELLRQPPTGILLLARAMQVRGNVEGEIEVRRKAQRQYPGDFWINFELAYTLSGLGHSHRDEAVSFLRAALAVRPQSIAVLNNLGLALKAQGKLDEAIACYRRAIELDPKFVRAHIHLGYALHGQNKLDEAIRSYRKAIDLDPKYAAAAAYNNLGSALFDQKKLDQAIAAFRTAIGIDPKNAFTHHNLGNALAAQGKVDEAIACYRTAIRLDPKLVRAHINLGFNLYRQGKLDEAIAAYRKAIELNPKAVTVHNHLGLALKAQGKVDEAIACYRTAIDLDPKSANAHSNLGNALTALGKLDDGIACQRTAIRLDPKFTNAHNNLGSALVAQGKVDEAIACYRTAIDLDPKNTSAHYNLGSALAAQGKVDEAIACYRTAIRLDPKLVRAHINLGFNLYRQGKLDEAIAAYRTAIELDPKSVIAYNGLGTAQLDRNKLVEAEAQFRTAIDLDPKLAVAHNMLGKALTLQNKLDEAIACYHKAIALDPKDASPHYGLGFALMRQGGKDDDVIAAYRQAIKLEWKFAPLAYYGLGNALMRQGKCDDATAAFRQAIELDPKYADAHNGLGNALLAKGQVDDAIAAYREAVRLKPNVAAAHYYLGLKLQAKGDLDGAERAYREAVRLDGKHHGAAIDALAELLLSRGNLKEAFATHQKIIILDPKNASAHYHLGNALKTNGDLEEAIAEYTKALSLAREAAELAPKSSLAWQVLGWVHYRTGDWKASIEALEKSCALQDNPKGGDAGQWFVLAMAHWKLAEKEKARELYDRAVQWMDKYQAQNQELRRFRAEAADLLGIEKKKD